MSPYVESNGTQIYNIEIGFFINYIVALSTSDERSRPQSQNIDGLVTPRDKTVLEEAERCHHSTQILK